VSDTLHDMARKFLLEIAVGSFERAVAAERAGADRLELCVDLEVAGLTPSLDLIRKVRAAVNIPVHVLVRPRAGNFVYSSSEFARMREQIAAIGDEKVQGVVLGVLLADGSVDRQRTVELVGLASPMQVTFHRAFDSTKDIVTALQDVVVTGAHRILTSGGASDARSGATVVRSLVRQAGDRITILPGGGIDPGNIAGVARATGAREFHTGLGGAIPYASSDVAAFESAIRDCIANLRG
jgi:copper homeostasis protein